MIHVGEGVTDEAADHVEVVDRTHFHLPLEPFARDAFPGLGLDLLVRPVAAGFADDDVHLLAVVVDGVVLDQIENGFERQSAGDASGKIVWILRFADDVPLLRAEEVIHMEGIEIETALGVVDEVAQSAEVVVLIAVVVGDSQAGSADAHPWHHAVHRITGHGVILGQMRIAPVRPMGFIEQFEPFRAVEIGKAVEKRQGVEFGGGL